MKNLGIAIGAVFLAYMANFGGWLIVGLVIASISVYVFGLLLYQAQLLPEAAMIYLDNRLIHDGQTPKEVKADLSGLSVERSINAGLSETFDGSELEADEIPIDNPDVYEDEEVIHPLLTMLFRTSGNLGVDLTGIEILEKWISTVSEDQAKTQIMAVIRKIEEAAGIAPSIRIEVNGETLEVVV